MHAGKLNERVTLAIPVRTGDRICYEPVSDIWVYRQTKSAKNLFSSIGIGAETVEFTARARKSLTLHHAIQTDGAHYFLTYLEPLPDRVYVKILAALVDLCDAALIKQQAQRGGGNVIKQIEVETLHFQAVLTEKYQGFSTEEEKFTKTRHLVLITPKLVNLREGDVIRVHEHYFVVAICHCLDRYKNEYEVRRKEDV